MSGSKVHIALNVADLSKSIDFYRAMFGVEPVKVQQAYAKFDIVDPLLNLVLNEKVLNERPSDRKFADDERAVSHFGVQVASTDEVLKSRRAWEAVGLAAREEMQTDCCYALQDKAWVCDPDGNEWEVFVVLADTSGAREVCCAAVSSEDRRTQPAGKEIGSTEKPGQSLPVLSQPCCS